MIGAMQAWIKLVALSLIFAIGATGTQTKENNAGSLLFSPSALHNAPDHIRRQLEEMHCRVFKKNNLIMGKLASDTQDDWAAACVINDKIQPVVLWGGKVQCDSHPAPARDFKELLADPVRDMNIGLADARKIAMYHDAFGGPEKLPPIKHAGLEVGDEQASVIYLCQDGKWLELMGED